MIALLLACSASEPPPTALADSRLWVWRSPDRRTWTRDPEPLAEGFDSLGLAEVEPGVFRLSGLDHRRRVPGYERYLPLKTWGFEGDLDRWERGSWAVDDAGTVNFVDPQWFEGQLFYTQRDGVGGDPALDQRPNALRSSPPPTTWRSGVGLADPSPVRFEDRFLLFATSWGKGVMLFEGEPLAEVKRFGGVTVPFSVVVEGELWLLAQQTLEGARQPVLARSSDGRSWSSFERVLPADHGLKSCTSPVLAVRGEGGVLLCVEESLRPQGSPAQ